MSQVKYVVLYESGPDVLALAPVHMAAHSEHYEDYAARGLLVAIGTFEQPEVNGSMCVLTTREAAEEFAATDPFVVHGVVRSYRVHAWTDVLA
ncbi:YciI family protein [Cellulomonas sp. ICMP 17802]|uniref:YciI family protein n=1 Tax=Cellulomonas sp. ICMP 17802 TaxID=3239199 RepID=UPI00351B2064